jgi:hypothetical protein
VSAAFSSDNLNKVKTKESELYTKLLVRLLSIGH